MLLLCRGSQMLCNLLPHVELRHYA